MDSFTVGANFLPICRHCVHVLDGTFILINLAFEETL